MTALYQKCCRKDSLSGRKERVEPSLRIMKRCCDHHSISLALPGKREILSSLRTPRTYLAPSPPGVVQADLTSNPHQRPLPGPGLGPGRGSQCGPWVLGFSGFVCRASNPAPYVRRQTSVMDFSTLPHLGEQTLWVRPAAINFREITPSD